ncbi:hypothetical protein MXB_4078, partial [Myxobolus squamalis]
MIDLACVSQETKYWGCGLNLSLVIFITLSHIFDSNMQIESCAKCSKTVYPIWHKSCFACTECEIVLTTKNAKGFEKNPYVTSDDPRVAAARKAQNTVSNVNYKSISKTPSGASHNPTLHGDFSSKQDSKDQSPLSNTRHEEFQERSGSISADK